MFKMSAILLVTFFLLLVVSSWANTVKPGCLFAEKQIDLTSYPFGGSPVSWMMTPGSSLFGSTEYLPIAVRPNCNPSNFSLDRFFYHLNSSYFSKNLLFTEKTTSTQDLARDFTGLNGLVVIADQQARGRGRAGQGWLSPMGDIYMTVNVNLNDTSVAPLLQAVAAMSVVNAVHEKLSGYQDLDLSFVWPNSVAWNERKIKLAGVLVEQSPLFEQTFSIGIGVRLSSFSGLPTLTSSIKAHNYMFGADLAPIKREELAARILNNLDSLIELLKQDSQCIRDLMASKWANSKKTVQLSFTGLVTGITAHGELIVKDKHGIVATIHPDLHIVTSDDTIVSSPVYSQMSNTIYDSEM